MNASLGIDNENDNIYCDIHTPNKAKPYALQVCNAGAMPESFEDWLKSNSDDIGGNWTPDRIISNHDQYDNERHHFA